MQPTFSVIIPTHNRAGLLPRAIRSVLSQTFMDYELIVIDDASTHNTREVVESFRDGRIIYLRREQNGGAAASRNIGIRQARGRYISFLDDDDEYYPKFLEATHKILANADERIGFCWCWIRIVQDIAQAERFIREKRWNSTGRSVSQALGIGTGCGLTIRRQVFDMVGVLDEGLKSMEDTEFLFRLVRYYDFIVVAEVLVKVHEHSTTRVSRQLQERVTALEEIVKRNVDFLNMYPHLYSNMLCTGGRIYYQIGNYARARQLLFNALWKRPLNWKAWKAILLFELKRIAVPILGMRT